MQKLNKILMHMNHPVAEVVFDGSGRIRKVSEIINPERFPISTAKLSKKNMNLAGELSDWWTDTHTIPEWRIGGDKVRDPLGVDSFSELVFANNGISSLDKYWIKDPASSQGYVDINHEFDSLAGASAFVGTEGVEWGEGLRDLDESVAITMPGMLTKFWDRRGDKVMLFKGGDPEHFRQEPFNEVIATHVSEFLQIPHAKYELEFIKGLPYSKCESFLGKDQELVMAKHIFKSGKKVNSENEWQYYLRRCAELGIDPSMARDAFVEHSVLDSVIANEDRHFLNFGFIRSAESLGDWEPIPAHDSGMSLFMRNQYANGHSTRFVAEMKKGRIGIATDAIKAPPTHGDTFRGTHNDMIKMLIEDKKHGVDLRHYIPSLQKLERELPEFVHEKLKACEMPSERRDLVAFGAGRRAAITSDIIKKAKSPSSTYQISLDKAVAMA